MDYIPKNYPNKGGFKKQHITVQNNKILFNKQMKALLTECLLNLCFELKRTSPLGVPLYAFGSPSVQFVYSALLFLSLRRCFRIKNRVLIKSTLFFGADERTCPPAGGAVVGSDCHRQSFTTNPSSPHFISVKLKNIEYPQRILYFWS